MHPYYPQHVETYLQERRPDLMKGIPAIEEPVEFHENSTKVTLKIPDVSMGCEIISDTKPQVYTYNYYN